MSQATGIAEGVVPAAEPPRTPLGVMIRLQVMMFLEFAIQGAWLPLLFPFFTNARPFTASQVGWLGAIGAVGAVASPLIAGQLADRKFNAERVLGVAHFIGAALVLRMAYAQGFWELMVLSFLYGLLYTPTLALVNAIAFKHLRDRDRDFGKVRVFGTIGWICAGIGVAQWLYYKAGQNQDLAAQTMGDAWRLSAILGVVFGVVSFLLPRTPPAVGQQRFAPLEAMKEIRRQPLITLFVLAFPVATVHSLFFASAAEYLRTANVTLPNPDIFNRIFGVGGGGVMTLGQMSEVVVLALMPLIAKNVPKKVILTVGLLAYILRFAAFAYLPVAWAILPALALHGLVFGCFFFVVFMVVDEHTTGDVRSSAQNLFNFIIFGVGVILGSLLTGWIQDAVRVEGRVNWHKFFSIAMWATIACLAAFLVFYPNRSRVRQVEGLAAA
jgi:nucleoside transporter